MTFLRSEPAIERLDTAWGPVWRVCRYDEVKWVLSDERFQQIRPSSNINVLLADGRFEEASRVREQLQAAGAPVESGLAVNADATSDADADSDGRALRLQVMNAVAAPHNVRRRAGDIEALANNLSQAFAASAPPASASEGYSAPLCARAMCVLLGVSPDESANFVSYAGTRTPVAGIAQLSSRVRGLIHQRQESPRMDVVSDLLAKGYDDRRQVARLTNVMTWALMGSNWEVPAAVIDFGFSLLLANPEQRRRLAEEPSLSQAAVEEILRLFKSSEVARGGLVRYAVTDVDIADTPVQAGDIVLADVAAANRDGRVFPDPERFDVGRQPNPHLTFGYGSHMCRFITMSRVLVATGLNALLEAVPYARAAAAPDGAEPEPTSRLRSGEFDELWITW